VGGKNDPRVPVIKIVHHLENALKKQERRGGGTKWAQTKTGDQKIQNRVTVLRDGRFLRSR